MEPIYFNFYWVIVSAAERKGLLDFRLIGYRTHTLTLTLTLKVTTVVLAHNFLLHYISNYVMLLGHNKLINITFCC